MRQHARQKVCCFTKCTPHHAVRDRRGHQTVTLGSVSVGSLGPQWTCLFSRQHCASHAHTLRGNGHPHLWNATQKLIFECPHFFAEPCIASPFFFSFFLFFIFPFFHCFILSIFFHAFHVFLCFSFFVFFFFNFFSFFHFFIFSFFHF